VTVFSVIACDKREAFAQGSDSDEAIHLSACRDMDCFASLAMTAAGTLSGHPRRFAFAAIESRARWAIADASDACLRMSSAAVPS
jgi:hypothetical protein